MLRESLTAAEVAALLPAEGAGACIIKLGERLYARAGHVQKVLFALRDAGAARVKWWGDETDGGPLWWRVAGAVVPELTIKAGTPAEKPDGGGNVGAADLRPSVPLKLYGADPNRRTVPLDAVRQVEEAKHQVARRHATEAIARAERTPDLIRGIRGLLACEADALADAAEMVRARIRRIEQLEQKEAETAARAAELAATERLARDALMYDDATG